MKRFAIILMLLLMPLSLLAQVDKKEVRRGNSRFRHGDFRQAEIDYRKGVVKDSTSFASTYNLANTLYKQKDYEGAGKMLDKLSEQVQESQYAAQYWFNQGDVALQKKDYAAAVKAFRESLLIRPDDLTAKENYIYAKKMMENQQQGQQGQQGDNSDQDQNQDQQNQDQNQDQQDQDQNQDQQDQNQDQKNQDQQSQQPQISPQQAQQMLQAIQAKEKETQDKVEKKKAEAMKARQKEKNW